MIYFLIIVALIIYLFVEIFRYQKVKANAFSKKEVAKAANEHASKLSYIDPVITCDYCGSKIDTKNQKVCPHCGAAYDKDHEWIVRHAAEEEFIEEGTRDLIAAREKKAAEETKKILKRIRITIKIIIAMIAFVLLMVGIADLISYQSEFRKSERLNGKSTYHVYSPADYKLVGDGVLYDNNDVKISVTGFYVDDQTYDSDLYGTVGYVKLEFHVENNRSKPISVVISSNAYNGVVGENCPIYDYSSYRPGDYVVYEEIHNVPQQQINEIVFDRIEVRDRKYEFRDKITEPVVLKTTSTYEQKIDYEDGTLVFTNDSIDIYCKYAKDNYNEGYYLYIVNKSGKGFAIQGNDVKVDGDTDVIYGFYNENLPADYIFQSDLYAAKYGKEEYKDLENHKVEISLYFKCAEDPSLTFETPYIELR